MLDILLAEPPAGCRRHFSQVNVDGMEDEGCQMTDITFEPTLKMFSLALLCAGCREKIRSNGDIQ